MSFIIKSLYHHKKKKKKTLLFINTHQKWKFTAVTFHEKQQWA